MPFEIIRDDITHVQADAIVNTANPQPVIGAGVDSMIHRAAGPQLLQAREAIGSIPVGEARLTSAYALPARYVIHTVGPIWYDGDHGEIERLEKCYVNSLQLALEAGCTSIAFPLISSGAYGFPKDLALQAAIRVFSAFLTQHEMDIRLVVFDRESFRISGQLFHRVQSYIDENYADRHEKTMRRMERLQPRMPTVPKVLDPADEFRFTTQAMPFAQAEKAVPTPDMCACAAPDMRSLDELLAQTDAGFTETLLKLIDQTGCKDSEIYNRANVSRQHFSKIRNNLQYKPTKATALAFAVALELDLDQTRDLLRRAGYALSNSSKFDVILRYFIEQGNYDLFEINATLFRFDQPLLGA